MTGGPNLLRKKHASEVSVSAPASSTSAALFAARVRFAEPEGPPQVMDKKERKRMEKERKAREKEQEQAAKELAKSKDRVRRTQSLQVPKVTVRELENMRAVAAPAPWPPRDLVKEAELARSMSVSAAVKGPSSKKLSKRR